jgi:cytochrome c oxidase subunit IV
MSGNHTANFDLSKHVRAYLVVFASLAVLTVLTVAVSYLHLTGWKGIALGLLIATVKGTLVACYFMHLISERKVIFLILLFTAVFFLGMLLLPVAGLVDQVRIQDVA